MKKICFSLLLLLPMLGCQATANPTKTDLLYNGHLFSVPQKTFVIASLGGNDNTLVLRYGPEKGKKYLAFAEMKDDENADYGCDQSVFFGTLFTASPSDGCNVEQLTAFKSVFVDGHDVGEWAGDKLTVYFSIGSEQSFLFAFDTAGKAIKIDTDFMTKAELEEVVNRAL
ncbi:hypothetical protein [Arsukibacterium perlucidum]|uniref:hypothetical protein n=1 Tax=Arsukibacterium perlucidum TaxID=368811 RepID=UPI0012FA1C61|nr:hypothetical protein [Arsukibacterium perlucidum]